MQSLSRKPRFLIVQCASLQHLRKYIKESCCIFKYYSLQTEENCMINLMSQEDLIYEFKIWSNRPVYKFFKAVKILLWFAKKQGSYFQNIPSTLFTIQVDTELLKTDKCLCWILLPPFHLNKKPKIRIVSWENILLFKIIVNI